MVWSKIGNQTIYIRKSWKNCYHATYTLDDGRDGGYTWPIVGEIILHAFREANNNAPDIIRKVRLVRIPRWALIIFAYTNRVFARLLRYAPMLTPGKVKELTQSHWLGDNTEFTRATGWEPGIRLEAGLETMYSLQ